MALIMIDGYCLRCKTKTSWHIDHIISNEPPTRIEHCFVCNECGLKVIDRKWDMVQRNMVQRQLNRKGDNL